MAVLTITPASEYDLTVAATRPFATCQDLRPDAWILAGEFGDETPLDLDIQAGVLHLYTETRAADITHAAYDGTDPCLRDAEGSLLQAFDGPVPYPAE